MKKMTYIIIGIVVLVGIFVILSAKYIDFINPETRSGAYYIWQKEWWMGSYPWQKEWWESAPTEKNPGENQSTKIIENITYEELQKLLNTKVRLKGKAIDTKGVAALSLIVTNKIAGKDLNQETIIFLEGMDSWELEGDSIGKEVVVSGKLVYKKVNDYVSKFEIDDGILKERMGDGKDYVLEQPKIEINETKIIGQVASFKRVPPLPDNFNESGRIWTVLLKDYPENTYFLGEDNVNFSTISSLLEKSEKENVSLNFVISEEINGSGIYRKIENVFLNSE